MQNCLDSYLNKYEFYDNYGNKTELILDEILLYVENKSLWIQYKNRLNKIISKGTISIFFTRYIPSPYLRSVPSDIYKKETE